MPDVFLCDESATQRVGTVFASARPKVAKLYSPSVDGTRTHARSLRLAAVSITLISSIARAAAPNDERAERMAADAMNTDYLATNFKQAQMKLSQALALCSHDGACSAGVRARIHRELGVVYIAGLNELEGGKQQFREGLALDPALDLDKDLTTPEMRAAFDAVRAESGAPAPAAVPAAAPAGPAPAATVSSSDKPTPGEIVHEPPAEQAILTPVPVYVELPEGVTAAKVTVRYKPFGATAWKSVEMSRRKDGYGAEVPCLDVGSTTGDLEYYIVASDAGGDVAAFSGTRNAPHKVPIKNELSGDPPHLPGKPPAAQCQDVSDCPPGFPGCVSGEKKPASMTDGNDAALVFAKNWLSLSVQEDILFLSSSKGACSGGNEYSCFYGDSGRYYGDIPYDKSGNEIAGGARLATTRLLAGYDRIFGGNIGIGVRLGFAFAGGPKAPSGNAFFPLHAEARVTYTFGTEPLARKGIRPYVHLSGGLAEIDGHVSVPAYADAAAYAKDDRLGLTAWKKTGTAFVGLGGGVMYAITPKSGPFLDVRLMQMLGVSGTAISPLLGYGVGF